MAVEFHLLGDIEVRVDGRVVDVGHARQRCVLVALLVDAGRAVPADQLLERVWAERPPQRARNALSGYVSRLRQLLAATGDVVIGRQPEGYVLTVDPMAVDLYRFQHLAAQARAAGDNGDHDTAADRYEQALGLWRGEAFATLDTPWVHTVRTALDAQRLATELDRNDLALDRGRHAELVGELLDRAAAQPLDERLAGQLLLALYRCGRQADALARYEHLRRRLAEELGADPSPPLQRLHAAILRQDSALDLRGRGPVHQAPSNLPIPLTSFIGRDDELAEVRGLLASSRLVTLTGVGGAGKSRLALEAARAAMPEHPDGTWLIELAALTQPDLLVPVVAAALGVRERPERPLVDLLVERLRDAAALLVLDNCEHLLPQVAELVRTLLAAGTRLRILATSRERLGITGEVLRPISGLAVPEPGADSPAALRNVEAVRLLVDRAAAVDPGFGLRADTAAATAQICRRLDGLPLAIELAAAGVNALGVEHITAHLDDRFRLLTHGDRTVHTRHQTLRATVDWSYGSLGAAERRLFDRLAVFVGGFTLDAVETVCVEPDAGPEPAPVLLARLVDKSLVIAESPAGVTRRYRMLETLRAYGLERLDERGETSRLRDLHAAYVMELVEAAGSATRTTRQTEWLRRLETEHGNIRAALKWAHERGDAVTAVRIAGSLHPLWDRHGHYGEGRRWLDQVLAMDGPVPLPARARALDTASGLAVAQGDLRQSTAAGEQAAELCRQAGDETGLARALQHLGLVAVYAADLGRAAALLDESLRHARAAGDPWVQSWSLLFLAVTAMAGGEHVRAAELGADCEALLRPAGDPEALGWALIVRAGTVWLRGDHPAMREPLHEGLRCFQDLGHLWGLSVGFSSPRNSPPPMATSSG
jgi:predicted ATPase/DNA-binding SARP family transcriptional activator